jgi:hypothetical protein
MLRADILNWLLESADPSVRFWALQTLQDKPPTHAEVQAAQEALMRSPAVKAILAAQAAEGYWNKPDNMYLPKYTATTHSLLILAELGAKRTPAIERAMEHLFKFQLDSGHFTIVQPKTKKGYASVLTDGGCFTGNILYYAIHFGYLNDPRVQRAVDFLIRTHSAKDGGWSCRAYPINRAGVFPTNCYMAMMKVLRGLSAIPKRQRSASVQAILKKDVEVTLENRIFRYLRAPDGSRKVKQGWTRFGFPLFYQSDALEVLDTLTRLHVRDDRMQDAIDLVLANRGPDGKWRLQNTFNGKMWHDVDVKRQPSKWITLRALSVLRRFYAR